MNPVLQIQSLSPCCSTLISLRAVCVPRLYARRETVIRCAEAAPGTQSGEMRKPKEFKRGLIVPQRLLGTGKNSLVCLLAMQQTLIHR
jgi:hypothetical protein